MPKAFENITVVDFSQVLAGPFATQQLAFLGANVIKVEPPGKGEGGRHIRASADTSPPNMSSVFLSVNSGKRSMTLDLKHPRAADVVHRLIAQAEELVKLASAAAHSIADEADLRQAMRSIGATCSACHKQYRE